MDVRCGRCGTEYEFDDALISERGTTVKCTNCGYQFKVYPPQAGAGAPERWIVRTLAGRELVYTSLRDLQKGITQRQVGPDDQLSRGNQQPRPLSSIAELEPFFRTSGAPISRKPSTLHGVAPPANPHGAPAKANPLRAGPQVAVPPAVPRAAPRPPPVAPLEAQVAAVQRFDAHSQTQPEFEPPTLPHNEPPEPPPEARPPQQVPAEAALTPTPSAIRESLKSYDELPADPRDIAGISSRRIGSRWIAALVIAGALLLFALSVGRRFLARYSQTPPQSSERPTDSRVAGMLDQSKRLLEEGDLEGAKEQLDKATALAENERAVLAALARLETIRADMLWLKLRLLDPGDEALVQATHRQLGRRVGKAREAVDRAAGPAADDATIKRARVDVLRLEGELGKARALIKPVAENASQPENAYVLAALDLAEPSPVWSSVVDRLRSAAAAEREIGLARGALIYALVRSGEIEQAKSELAKLESRAKSHALLLELQGFVRRHAAMKDAGTDSVKEVAAVDPAKLPTLDTRPGPEDDVENREAPAGDFRQKLKQAAVALQRGELDRAEQLYNAVLAQQPRNTEALAGLGDVARQRKDPQTAERMYEKVLKENPTYLPAMVARADAKWDAGDRKGAIAIYRRVLEQAGAGSEYGQRASARISQGEGSSGRPEADKEKPPPAEEQKPPKKEEQPHIDTTDLPELNK